MGAPAAALDTPAQQRAVAEATRLLVPKLTKYVPHVPEPPQQAFLLLDDKEAFYGGAAGGGKSDALLMAALQYVDQGDYHALILRRTFANLVLPGAIMDRALSWLEPTDAVWTAAEHKYTFPSGATLSFGHIQYEHDKYNYASSEFQYIGFDELTEFTETMFRFMFSRLRRNTDSKVPLRMRAASNPGGVGHEWVKRRFIDEGREYGRPFIPARLKDNPYLDQKEYTDSLMQLDPITRQRLLDGDWTVRPIGALFRRDWFKVVDQLPAPIEGRPVRYWDLAATEEEGGNDPDWTVGVLMARLTNHQFAVLDVQRARKSPGDVERLVGNMALADGKRTKIRMEQEPGSSGKTVVHYYVRRLAGYDIRGLPSTGDKKVRAGALASQAQIGNVVLKRGPWISDYLDEVEQFTGLPNSGHDDQVDASSGAFNSLLEPDGRLRMGR